jgi:hypothetical protein
MGPQIRRRSSGRRTYRGASPAVIYVSITNRGNAPYNGDGGDTVSVCWAKAQAGHSWPVPWDGSVPQQGGAVSAPLMIGSILPGESQAMAIPWPSTPDPADYGGDGHFCLLAFIAKPSTPAFDGFGGTDLNQNVLKWSKVAWRNIHIVPVLKGELGDIVLANHTDAAVATQVTFEVLDNSARPVTANTGKLFISPIGAALEWLRQQQPDTRFLEAVDDGLYRVVDPATGIPRVVLKPGDVLPFHLSYVPRRKSKGFVVRVTQFSLEDDTRKVLGGQTFVAGQVKGFSKRQLRNVVPRDVPVFPKRHEA